MREIRRLSISSGFAVLTLVATCAASAFDAAPQTPALEAQAGAAFKTGPASSFGFDVETPPLISGFVGVRGGLTFVTGSHYAGPNPNQLAGKVQLTASWWRLEVATGPEVLQHDDHYNSGRVNIASSLDGAITSHWHVRLEHWSNAQTHFPNDGRNTFFVSYRF